MTPDRRRAGESASAARIRINRFLGMCGVTSRRKAEELVAAGSVSVNGLTVEDLAYKVDPASDIVRVDGRQVTLVHEPIYLVLNKPKDTITTARDERGRRTVLDLVPSRQRIYPIGRLDRNTTGVLLLTNDGALANRLMHPRQKIQKSYLVFLDKPLAPADADTLRKGIRLEDGKTAPAEIHAIPHSRGRQVGVIIHEGRNRQVHRMFEAMGYMVEKLDRVAYGSITLDGLPRGRVRPLSHREVHELRRAAGLES